MRRAITLAIWTATALLGCDGPQRDNPADPGAGSSYQRHMGSLVQQGKRTLLATTELGATYWLRTFDEEIKSAILNDLDADGSPEAVIILGGNTPGITGRLYVIAAGPVDTMEVMISAPDSSILDPLGGLTSSFYEVRDISFPGTPQHDILVAYANASFFKSALCLYHFTVQDHRVTLTKEGEFWNAGNMGEIAFADLDGDGHDEILVKAYFNDLARFLVDYWGTDTIHWENGAFTRIDQTTSANIAGLLCFSSIPTHGLGPPWTGSYQWALFFLPKGNIGTVHIREYSSQPGMEMLLNAQSSEQDYQGNQWYYVGGDGMPLGTAMPPVLADSRQYGWGLVRGDTLTLVSFDPGTGQPVAPVQQ